MDCTKILNLREENLNFVHSLNVSPMSLKIMPKAFHLTCKKGHYPHFFNTDKNLDNNGPYTEPEYYGAAFISGDERAQFLEWYEEQKSKFSDIRKQS
jgi:hypothetical protein